MQFLIADTFQASLARLDGEAQKAVKTAVFDLQINPANPGFKFHKLDRAPDKRFWSVRVNRDIRIIVHRGDAALLACYVDHHDDAYRWAERRRIRTHSVTGAAQLVELQEAAVKETISPTAARSPVGTPRIFDPYTDKELLGFGVPESWLAAVRAANEDDVLDVVERLPAEAAEVLLELAAGGSPPTPVEGPKFADPFEHPDARRRFRLVTDVEELRLALDYPWERWTIFLHPAQRAIVERRFSGPARVAGSAGTGKTVVALHRAAWLARRDPTARVLLTTFNDTLVAALRLKLARLVGAASDIYARITIETIDSVALELHEQMIGSVRLVQGSELAAAAAEAARRLNDHGLNDAFVLSEWLDVVDAWQLATWDEYRVVPRLGRKTGLPEGRRKVLWQTFELMRADLCERGAMSIADVHGAVAGAMAVGAARPFSHVVVDEAQDLSVAQLRLLAAIAADQADGLFFAGDLGQRIFRTPFSWLKLGVDVRGRSSTLRVNYRTSHQIRSASDRLLPAELSDIDGNVETRAGTVSVFRGPEPEVLEFPNEADESVAVGAWIADRVAEGFEPQEVAIFVRDARCIDRALAAVGAAELDAARLDGRSDGREGAVSIGTMDLAKGLEFRAVAVIACDDDVLPSQARVEEIADAADLEDVTDTERQLLYVACTRARDRLVVTGVAPASEFLEDFAVG